MKRPEEIYMQAAIDAALKGIDAGQSPFGACIVHNGKILCAVHNIVWDTTDPTAHAEVHAIRAASKRLESIDLSECVIYSTCEPCPMCFAACHWARIPKIVYGATIADADNAGFNELKISNGHLKKEGNLHVEIHAGFMQKECVELFEKWCSMKKGAAY